LKCFLVLEYKGIDHWYISAMNSVNEPMFSELFVEMSSSSLAMKIPFFFYMNWKIEFKMYPATGNKLALKLAYELLLFSFLKHAFGTRNWKSNRALFSCLHEFIKYPVFFSWYHEVGVLPRTSEGYQFVLVLIQENEIICLSITLCSLAWLLHMVCLEKAVTFWGIQNIWYLLC